MLVMLYGKTINCLRFCEGKHSRKEFLNYLIMEIQYQLFTPNTQSNCLRNDLANDEFTSNLLNIP